MTPGQGGTKSSFFIKSKEQTGSSRTQRTRQGVGRAEKQRRGDTAATEKLFFSVG